MRSVGRPVIILAVFLLTFLSIGFAVDSLRAAEVARVPWFQKGGAVFAPGNPSAVRWVFSLVPNDRRLDVQFVSCGIKEPAADVVPFSAFLGVNDALSLAQRRHLLPWMRFTYPEGSVHAFSYDISQPVVMSFNAGERPQVAFAYYGGSATFIPCSLSGELVFLQ